MARRKIYSNLNKVGQYRPEHVDGQTLYKVFQCLNPDCTEMITVKKDDIDEDYSIVCPKCGYEHYSGGEQHLLIFRWMLITLMARQFLCRKENLLSLTMSTSKMLHCTSIA